jgi:hypothetical protein
VGRKVAVAWPDEAQRCISCDCEGNTVLFNVVTGKVDATAKIGSGVWKIDGSFDNTLFAFACETDCKVRQSFIRFCPSISLPNTLVRDG